MGLFFGGRGGKMAGMAQNKQKCLIFITVARVRVENQISRIS